MISQIPGTLMDQGRLVLSNGKHIGLGLYISRQISKIYGGDLDFISEHHKGSTFFFTMNLEIDQDQ